MRKLWRVIKLVAYSLCIISTAPRHIIFTSDEEMGDAKGKGKKEEPMNVGAIIIKHLEDIGAEGLCIHDERCGCGIDELFLCEELCLDCVPAWKGVPPLALLDESYVYYYPTKAEASASKKGEL